MNVSYLCYTDPAWYGNFGLEGIALSVGCWFFAEPVLDLNFSHHLTLFCMVSEWSQMILRYAKCIHSKLNTEISQPFSSCKGMFD